MWVETFLIFMNRRMDFLTIQNGILNISQTVYFLKSYKCHIIVYEKQYQNERKVAWISDLITTF